MATVIKPNILWFKDISKNDITKVGGKGANLGEMANAKLPIPNGFCVTAYAYFDFLKKSGLEKEIKSMIDDLDYEDNKELNRVSVLIKKMIIKAGLPRDLIKEIEEAYYRLGGFPVAVRSSATAEDLPEASFAGQQATFLNVAGKKEVTDSVLKCYASLFEARAIYYRALNQFDHMRIALSAVVQNMVESDCSGILFTVDPVTEDSSKLVIEAGYGLGEAIVSGSVTPDRYIIDKKTIQIVEKEINSQDWKIVRNSKGGDKHVSVANSFQNKQKITDEQIIKLAKIGLSIEEHYGKPQDTEWAIEDGKIFFLQSRPITTLGKKQAASSRQSAEGRAANCQPQTANQILLRGAAASLGVAFGPVKIIHKPTEIDKISADDVLVTEMTTPDFVPAMKKAKAIITDTGGRTCHAAIVSRELGIPCVVGTGTATHTLKNSQVVTVDGAKGLVYKGKVQIQSPPEQLSTQVIGGSAISEEIPVTGTKVYVNLAEPEKASEIAKLPVDGVGLLRAEFMIANLGEHPKAMVEAGRKSEYVDALVDGLKTIAESFNPRPVVYRATDFKTNEYRGLKGGEKFEPVEDNPMIGFRGASRYIAEPDMFGLELEAIKKVREDYDLKNLWIMIPFVRTITEMAECMRMIAASGLRQGNDLKIWMMCEIPSNVILLDRFIDLGIDGISIGSNDLTQLTLGVDRDNQTLAKIFDERDEAVMLSLEYIIKTCRKRNITCSICGQAPSIYPEITEMMVKAGTTSVSVTSDMIIPTRKLIASVEKRILLQNILDR